MPKIYNFGLGPGQIPLLSKTVILTAADILAQSTTPFELVPAPGAGMMIGVDKCAFVYRFGTRSFVFAAGAPLVHYAGDATVGLVSVTNLSNLLTGPLSGFVLEPSAMSAAVPILPGDDNKAVVIDGIDLNAGPIATATLGAGGAGYAANDTGVITTGFGDATYKVLTVGGGGAVLTFSITAPGNAYTVGNGQATATGGAQPGVGAGFTVNITAVQKGDGTLKVVTYYQIVPVP
jgi:hypothetical protein